MGIITDVKVYNGCKVGIALEQRIRMVEILENDEGIPSGLQPAMYKGLYINILCFEISFTTILLKN